MSGASAKEMTASEVGTMVRRVGDIVGESPDMRRVLEHAVLRNQPYRASKSTVDSESTLADLFVLGMGAERYVGGGHHLARGFLEAIGHELRTLSYLVDELPDADPRINESDLSLLIYSLGQRCDVAAEIDRRFSNAMATAKAPARFPNLELALEYWANASRPRTWQPAVVLVARELEGDDVRVDKWPARLDEIRARLDSALPATSLVTHVDAKPRHKVMRAAARQGRTPKTTRRADPKSNAKK